MFAIFARFVAVALFLFLSLYFFFLSYYHWFIDEIWSWLHSPLMNSCMNGGTVQYKNLMGRYHRVCDMLFQTDQNDWFCRFEREFVRTHSLTMAN